MKSFVAILLLLFCAGVRAQEDCSMKFKHLENGYCTGGTTILCTDPCTEEVITGNANCTNAKHCCYRGGACVIKTLGSAPESVDYARLQAGFEAILRVQANINKSEETNKTEGRSYGGGGGAPFVPPPNHGAIFPQPGPGFGPYCPTFPQTCRINYGAPPNFNAPVNVPYCHRIACNPSNPLLDNSVQQCVAQPGCYFDHVLFQYRSILGQAILPGVPVCHLAIRNRVFQRKAAEFAQQYGSWNPLLTQCLINENRDQIFGDSVGCRMLDILQYFGHHPKRAGWPSIRKNDCALIDGCWKTTGRKSHCVYPLQVNHVAVRSSNDKQRSAGHDAFYQWGLPSCMPFSNSLTGGQFLSNYHSCLATGCAVNINREKYWKELWSVGSHLNGYVKYQYYQLILSGQVRADNYQSILNNLNPVFPTYPTYGPPIGSYSLKVPKTPTGRYFPIPGAGYPQPTPPRVPGYPQPTLPRVPGYPPPTPPRVPGYPQPTPPRVPGYPPQVPGYPPQVPGYPPNFVPPFVGGVPPLYPPQRPTCPYERQRLRYQGLPPLTGSLEGCCSKPLCYVPREQLYRQYSGVSSYLTMWSEYGACSLPCWGGIQNRTRVCIGKEGKPSKDCDPSAIKEQFKSCNEHECPRYGPWGDYGECTVTCGGGTKVRRRSCLGVGQCVGPATEDAACSTNVCPEWVTGEWGRCDAARCKTGFRTRTKTCVPSPAYVCPENETERRPCQNTDCPCVCRRGACNSFTCYYNSVCRRRDGSPCTPTRYTPPQPCFEHAHCRCRHPPYTGCTRSFNPQG